MSQVMEERLAALQVPQPSQKVGTSLDLAMKCQLRNQNHPLTWPQAPPTPTIETAETQPATLLNYSRACELTLILFLLWVIH